MVVSMQGYPEGWDSSCFLGLFRALAGSRFPALFFLATGNVSLAFYHYTKLKRDLTC